MELYAVPGGAPVRPADAPALWHVTLTVAGPPEDPEQVGAALRRLADERPPLLSGRYARDRAEVRYWEEALDLEDCAALALRLWGEHRSSAGLPPWRVVALEVLDRVTFQARVGAGTVSAVSAAGQIAPF